MARDITQERAREERARLLASALEGLDKAVSVVDRDGHFVYANAEHARLFGYDPETLSRLRAYELEVGDDRIERFQAQIDRARHGSISERALRRRVDGEEITVGVIMGQIADPGRELVLVITRDITQELAFEGQMRRSERLASMGTLLSGVAHELNNPLHAIGNFADLLLMDERGPDDLEALEIIRREAERAGKIVGDLRVIARHTQDDATAKDLVDLNDVLEHVIKLRRYTLDTNNIGVNERLIPSLPSIWATRSEMEQVVLNLVINAEHAMLCKPDGRELSVRTSSARSRVILQISDTGTGIPQENMDRIFDPFFTTKPPGEGTGLGLSMVHTIVSSHGGEIRVASSEDGTTFTVILPCAPDAEGEPISRDELGPAERELRILVVDDEPSIRRSVQIALERRGHEVRLARDGREALELIAQGEGSRYDVILSDLRMPGLGGDQLLTHLATYGEGLERSVVFMTGDAASENAARIMDATGNPTLIKPVKLDEIARVVEEVDRKLRAGAIPMGGQAAP